LWRLARAICNEIETVAFVSGLGEMAGQIKLKMVAKGSHFKFATTKAR
jgi:predicted translin family RNA/ssDNA-binding protein